VLLLAGGAVATTLSRDVPAEYDFGGHLLNIGAGPMAVAIAIVGAGTGSTPWCPTRDPGIVRRRLPRAEPGATSADYVMASIAELETTLGPPMVAYCRARGMVALGDAAPYRVWGTRRGPVRRLHADRAVGGFTCTTDLRF